MPAISLTRLFVAVTRKGGVFTAEAFEGLGHFVGPSRASAVRSTA